MVRKLVERMMPDWMTYRPSMKTPGVPVTEAFPAPLTQRQLWILGLGAVLSTTSHENLVRLHPDPTVHGQETVDFHRHSLERTWGVTDLGSLFTMLTWLLEDGHRVELTAKVGHPPLAWDYGRFVNVCRWSFAAQLIDEPTAWGLLDAVVAPTYATYPGWSSYVRDYLVGRAAWLGKSAKDTDRAVLSLWSPSRAADSPWQQVPWEVGKPVTTVPAPTEGVRVDVR